MIKVIGRRVLAMIGVLLALAATMFVLQRFTPADPVHVMLGAGATHSEIVAARHKLGYDQPLVVQYVRYVDDVVHGNLQMSLRTRNPVRTDLGTFLPATVELALSGMVMAILLGGLLGVLSALRVRGSGVLRVVMIAGASAPAFLVAELGIIVFYHWLHWLPASGQLGSGVTNAPTGPTKLLVLDSLLHLRVGLAGQAATHLVLPALCIAVLPAVAIGRVLRSSLVATLESDFVRTARSKGVRRGAIVWRHALRNSIGPALSMAGLQVGLMFAGVLVVETIFAWPGIGYYTSQSITSADFPAISGVTLVLGAAYVVINTGVDLLQAVAESQDQTELMASMID